MSAILPVYKRADLKFDHGEGVYLFSDKGDKYLDFATGYAVNSLGHCHPKIVQALKDQADKLWHVSNVYQIEGLEEFSQKLAANSFADKVFFCNSGAEAVECGLKMIRKYHDETGNPDKYRVITFEGCFHGRTLATISASGQEKLLGGFEPALDGFDTVPFNDLEAVKAAITPETGGILAEPIQGEGGIIKGDEDFIRGLREIADEHGLLLMFDEVQCGMGRTGKLFAHEWYGITPDILSSAKGIGNGFPLGACLATDNAAQGMVPGTHGTTYGSNPMAMAVGNAVIDIITEDGFLENVQKKAEYLEKQLEGLAQSFPGIVEELRGFGLMRGIKVKPDANELVEKLRDKGFLTIIATGNILRFLPPLIVEEEHIDEAMEKIRELFREIDNG